MIPPEGLAENLALLKHRAGGLREIAAWLDGWNSQRLHGGPRGADAAFFNNFTRFLRERYPEAGLTPWPVALVEIAGGDREALALFFELFEDFEDGKAARARLVEKGKHGPSARPRAERKPNPMPPGADPFAPGPERALAELIEAFASGKLDRPGDGTLAALKVWLEGWAGEDRRRWAAISELAGFMAALGGQRVQKDWTRLMLPLTGPVTDRYEALASVCERLERRRREVVDKFSPVLGAPVIPDGPEPGFPALPVLRNGTPLVTCFETWATTPATRPCDGDIGRLKGWLLRWVEANRPEGEDAAVARYLHQWLGYQAKLAHTPRWEARLAVLARPEEDLWSVLSRCVAALAHRYHQVNTSQNPEFTHPVIPETEAERGGCVDLRAEAFHEWARMPDPGDR
ncbi:hypothetical protein [Vannielia litorea]|uniref:Uncharacterized protein n=1 Tax=Vannielia litorea TaxID=1217970 RepID=A0A1N6ED25_9RHOB|nr:hypothetical protein [Vannielia litorea]SIN80945.1 hypothetical protein SAMN05444002_0618 [Vannielia litorea]